MQDCAKFMTPSSAGKLQQNIYKPAIYIIYTQAVDTRLTSLF